MSKDARVLREARWSYPVSVDTLAWQTVLLCI
jgi:hypothetical protein